MPDNKHSEEWKKLSQLKQNEFCRKISNEDYYFEGVIFGKFEYLIDFKQDIHFNNATFSGYARFEGVTFSRNVIFSGTKFSGIADFTQVIFSRDANFNNATFLADARFNRTKFSGIADFTQVIFSRDANFNNATFLADARFNRTKFSRVADFTQVIFSSDADFNDVTFSADARFNRTKFSNDADFYNTTLSADADFTQVIFSRDANFNNATFLADARFNGIKFSRGADFYNATFSSDADFNDVTFSSDADFYNATFLADARFEGATFFSDTDFHISFIQTSLNFIHSEFKKTLVIFIEECGNNIEILINHSTINGDFEIDCLQLPQYSLIELIGAKVKGNFSLNDTIIHGTANFNNFDVSGDIKINPSTIRNPNAQENIFRKVKTHAAELGNKGVSDQFFYLERVAGKKLLQISFIESLLNIQAPNLSKEFFINLIESYSLFWKYIFEWPMHYYFFYGAKPLRTFGIWLGIIIVFALIYWYNSLITLESTWDYLYFSVVNSLTPGYGGITPDSGTPRLVASIEAIFGAFTWGCFLTIFARKYMDK